MLLVKPRGAWRHGYRLSAGSSRVTRCAASPFDILLARRLSIRSSSEFTAMNGAEEEEEDSDFLLNGATLDRAAETSV